MTGRSAGLSPFENAAGVNPRLPISIRDASAVADEAANRDEFSKRVDGNDPEPGDQADQLFAHIPKERIRADNEGRCLLLRKAGKGRHEIGWSRGMHEAQFQSTRLRGRLHIP